ncbi:MAG: orotidine-5'-phosphate decarboxylase [Desulfurococcaceae archaeon]
MLVLALDPPFGSKEENSSFIRTVEETKDYVLGYKIGLPLILQEGAGVISQVKKISHKKVIADLKLADIGDIMVSTLRKLSSFEVDAVIAHGFIGVDDGIDKLVEESRTLSIDVIIVASMSHKGSTRYLDKHYEDIVQDALNLRVHGIVVPATRLDIIRKTREKVGNKLKLYSPGIGAQGAMPGDAICSGADFEIVGRYITRSDNPGKRAQEIYQAQLEKVRLCLGSQ